MNSLQANPSDATADFVQPDWNTKHGVGTAPATDDAQSFEDIYKKQREGAKARLQSND